MNKSTFMNCKRIYISNIKNINTCNEIIITSSPYHITSQRHHITTLSHYYIATISHHITLPHHISTSHQHITSSHHINTSHYHITSPHHITSHHHASVVVARMGLSQQRMEGLDFENAFLEMKCAIEACLDKIGMFSALLVLCLVFSSFLCLLFCSFDIIDCIFFLLSLSSQKNLIQSQRDLIQKAQ